MSDDAPWPLTEEERARIFEARERGGMCATCGRTLASDEAVWIERLVNGVKGWRRSPIFVRAPVGAECASPSFRAETEGREPERCLGCGRGVYYGSTSRTRRLALCSRVCGRRYRATRTKEGAPS